MKNPTITTQLKEEFSKNGLKQLHEPHASHSGNIFFNPIIESITDGFFAIDDHWIITYWNNEIEFISGIKRENVIGKGLWNFFSNQGNLKFYSECRRAKLQNISIRFEDFYEAQNAWIEANVYPTETGLAVFVKDISQVKSAEAAIKLSNDRYNLVAKATNDLLWDWDIITGEIYRNSTGVNRVYGHSDLDKIKTNQLWSEYIHPQDKKKIDEQIAYYISSENESSFSFEYRIQREDGNYNYISDKGYIIRNELGIVTRLIGAARDITAQKQAIHDIEESEQRYKSFVQQSTEGIWRIELDTPVATDLSIAALTNYCMKYAYLAECNDAFAKMHGFENAAQVIGIPLHKLMPADEQVNIAYFEKFFNSGFKVVGEISHEYDKNGNPSVFQNNMLGIVEDGYLKRAWGTKREITQQKKAEGLLLASEEQYRNLFNNNPCCIFIWNLDGLEIVEANLSAINLYGYSRDEFKELTVMDILHPEEHAEFLKMVEINRQNAVYRKIKTWRQLTKSGQVVFMEISSQHVTYGDKKSVLAIGSNVTEKVQLENSLNEERQIMQKHITDAVITGQERERLELGQELHDNINQILASTRLYIECALADAEPRKDLLEKSRFYLDSAMAEIRKLSKSLLPPSMGEISLLDALNDLANDITDLQKTSIHKKWKYFDEEDLDQKLKLTIFRIVQEQLNNIYRHSNAANATILLEKKQGTLLLSIEDDGIGFDPASKKNGVGLRNISSRAEVNNGTVEIVSTPGSGCKLNVTFLLPGDMKENSPAEKTVAAKD